VTADLHLRAMQIYHAHCAPSATDIEAAVAAGMIRKADLVDGETYVGYCRNASEARWFAASQQFVYLRKKFGSQFEELIPHPEDDEGYDVFVPVAARP
jgi:hypothetical protein